MAITDERLQPPRAATDLTRRVQRLVEDGTTELAASVLRVPLTYYRDPALLERERTALAHTPLALAETARIPAPHDYVVREVLGVSVVLSRDADGSVHALLNSCRHRGARPAEGCGSARRFTCPYHGWTYDSAGGLVGMPGPEGFAEVDRPDYGLVELACEERHGFVWVVLTAGDPIDVAAHLGPLDAELASAGLGEHEFLTERIVPTAANWKSALEAFAENYHFPYVHAGSILGQNIVPNTAAFDAYGPHHRLAFPSPWITDLEPDAPPLDGMSLIYWVYPSLVLAVTVVGAEIIEILPGDDPYHCTIRHGWMAREPAGNDDATRAGYEELFEAVHAAVTTEDLPVLESCTNGIRSGQHDHMLIGRNEPGVQNVVRGFAAALQVTIDSADSDCQIGRGELPCTTS